MIRKAMSVGIAAGMLVASIALGQKNTELPKREIGTKMTAIQKSVEAVIAGAGGNILTVEKKGNSDLVQVAREEQAGKVSIKVVINYPFPEPLDQTLGKAGVTTPEGWKVVAFEMDSFAKYETTGNDAKTIVDFIDAIFAKLFKIQPDSILIEKM